MSNAESTIKFAILNGMTKRAHITGASAKYTEIYQEDIFESLFHPSTRWAIEEYLKELTNKK